MYKHEKIGWWSSTQFWLLSWSILPWKKIDNFWNIMFGIIRDDFTKMSIYNLQDLMIAFSVSNMVKELLAFTFPHFRMFILYHSAIILATKHSRVREFILAYSRVHTRILASLWVRTRKLASAHSRTREFASLNSRVRKFVLGNSRVPSGRVLHGRLHCE